MIAIEPLALVCGVGGKISPIDRTIVQSPCLSNSLHHILALATMAEITQANAPGKIDAASATMMLWELANHGQPR